MRLSSLRFLLRSRSRSLRVSLCSTGLVVSFVGSVPGFATTDPAFEGLVVSFVGSDPDFAISDPGFEAVLLIYSLVNSFP